MAIYLGNKQITIGQASILSANPSGEDGTDIQRIKVNGENYNILTTGAQTVNPNPGGAGLSELSSLTIGSTDYSIDNGVSDLTINDGGFLSEVNFLPDRGGDATLSITTGNNQEMRVRSGGFSRALNSFLSASSGLVLGNNGDGDPIWVGADVHIRQSATITPRGSNPPSLENVSAEVVINQERVWLFGKIGVPSNTLTENFSIRILEFSGRSYVEGSLGGPKVLAINTTSTNESSPTSSLSSGWEHGHQEGSSDRFFLNTEVSWQDLSGSTVWFSIKYKII